MGCRKIVVIICMLILVLEAKPWRSRKHRVTSSQAVTTTKLVKTYTRKTSGSILPVYPGEEVLLATITPIDKHSKHKDPILHKAHKKSDYLLVKPLEIDGITISGINEWFVLDDFYTDCDIEEYYTEYIEEIWEETIYEYDDEWEEYYEYYEY